ncbi:hypothetical protein Pta02_35550 [Planobispora takensis]|uniref:Uncharacterized protein n=2 Tax=Planobispora takensis TaxID=1367882 RepID=A0A8J3SW05_9ACTN|nr:hypothetical protein Pta02_35550 [Planobispora takensis]
MTDMSVTLVFNHRPRIDPVLEAETVCWVCGVAVDPADRSLHRGEIAPAPPAPDDLPLLEDVTRIVRAELAETPVSLTDDQLDLLARRAARALYHRGAIRARNRWHPA